MASIPRYVETVETLGALGADEVPAGVSKAAYEKGVDNFNRAIDVIDTKSVSLVKLLQYISKNKDEIIRGAHELKNKWPYVRSTWGGGGGAPYEYKAYQGRMAWVFTGDYTDFIKNKLKKTNIAYVGSAYRNLLGAYKELQNGFDGKVAEVFFDGPYWKKFPDAYASAWYKNLSNSIFSDSGFFGKSKRLVQDLIHAIEKMAIDGDVTWPRNLDLPRLSRIKKAQDIVQTVERVEQVQRQAIGISTTNPDMPKFSIPKFTYPTIVPDNKPKWLLPVLVGGGALATILALKG